MDNNDVDEIIRHDEARYAAIVPPYLSGDLPLEDAAQELSWVMLHPEDRLELGWAILLDYARSNVGTHPKLVDLLVQLSTLPDAECENVEDEYKEWSGLPKLGWVLNSEWNSLDIPSESGSERRRIINSFININKFVALLTVTDVPVLQGKDMFCIWTMRSALEGTIYRDNATELDPSEAFIPAAAAWIDIAGPQMYEWDSQFPYGPMHGDPGRGGPLISAEYHGFCRGRWNFWRNRFGELAQDAGIELMEIAREAEIRMMEIERNAAQAEERL